MDGLDTIERRVERLHERLVSAFALSAAAVAASVVVSGVRAYFVLVSLGGAAWVLIESFRWRVAAADRESALDELVVAGSSDPRCGRRRADLGSARYQHRLAQMLRQTCEQSHCYRPGAAWLVDREAVHAVERDLRELATVFDHDAGHLPPAAGAVVHLLLASKSSPLYEMHPDPASERRAIQTAQGIIARCRAELDDRR